MKAIIIISLIGLLVSCSEEKESPENIGEKHGNNYCECITNQTTKDGDGPISCYEEHVMNLDKELESGDYSEQESEKAIEIFKNMKVVCEKELQQ